MPWHETTISGEDATGGSDPGGADCDEPPVDLGSPYYGESSIDWCGMDLGE
jgi:hypothetical protein